MNNNQTPVVHLIVIFQCDADQSPLAIALRSVGLQLVTFSRAVRLNYSSRILRYIIGWPRLLFFSFRAILASRRAQPQADAIIVNSHVDILVIALLRTLRLWRPPSVVLPGFIYTENRNQLTQALKYRYHRFFFSHTNVAICHSQREVDRYSKLFAGCGAKFIFRPYAIRVDGAAGYNEATLGANYILSAGRSARDYRLLLQSIRDLPIPLKIVNDLFPSNLLSEKPSHVEILRSCYDQRYIDTLAGCRFVVLPLAADNISAGQMVMLQAMAMGKPIIITRTETTTDYAEDGDGVIFVEPNNADELNRAIRAIWTDDALCERLGRRSAELFSQRYSIRAYAQYLAEAVREALARPH